MERCNEAMALGSVNRLLTISFREDKDEATDRVEAGETMLHTGTQRWRDPQASQDFTLQVDCNIFGKAPPFLPPRPCKTCRNFRWGSGQRKCKRLYKEARRVAKTSVMPLGKRLV